MRIFYDIGSFIICVAAVALLFIAFDRKWFDKVSQRFRDLVSVFCVRKVKQVEKKT